MIVSSEQARRSHLEKGVLTAFPAGFSSSVKEASVSDDDNSLVADAPEDSLAVSPILNSGSSRACLVSSSDHEGLLTEAESSSEEIVMGLELPAFLLGSLGLRVRQRAGGQTRGAMSARLWWPTGPVLSAPTSYSHRRGVLRVG